MARRREEMMDNAKWRDKEREQNVKRYQREDATEKAMLEKQKQSDSAEFIKWVKIMPAFSYKSMPFVAYRMELFYSVRPSDAYMHQ